MFHRIGNHVLKDATVKGKNMLPICATVKGKNMLHLWSMFVPLRVVPMGIENNSKEYLNKLRQYVSL